MSNTNDERVLELAKLIYAQNVAILNNFNRHEAKRTVIASKEAAKIFYEMGDDSGNSE